MCRPDKMPDHGPGAPGERGRPHGPPPEEIFKACEGKAADAVCSVTLGDHSIEGDLQDAAGGCERDEPRLRAVAPASGRRSAAVEVTLGDRARASAGPIAACSDDGVDVDLLTSQAPEPFVSTERRRRMAVLRGALARILRNRRRRSRSGWSLAEVAEATGVSLNTVRSRLRLAKTALRSVIDRDPAAGDVLSRTDARP